MEENKYLPCKYNKKENLNKFKFSLLQLKEDVGIKIDSKFIDYLMDGIDKDYGFIWVITEVMKAYPINSIQYNAIRQLLEQYVLWPIQGDEYSLCFDRGYPPLATTPDHLKDRELFKAFIHEELEDEYYMPSIANWKWVPRYTSEFNPLYVQISVGLIIVNESEDKICLLKCTTGNFKDKYTMIQGHAAYDPMVPLCDFYDNTGDEKHVEVILDYLMDQAKKELYEETNMSAVMSTYTANADKPFIMANPKFTKNVVYIPILNDKLHEISTYHAGVAFTVKVPDEVIDKLESGEPDNHICEVLPVSDISKIIEQDLCDEWLAYTLFEKYGDFLELVPF